MELLRCAEKRVKDGLINYTVKNRIIAFGAEQASHEGAVVDVAQLKRDYNMEKCPAPECSSGSGQSFYYLVSTRLSHWQHRGNQLAQWGLMVSALVAVVWSHMDRP